MIRDFPEEIRMDFGADLWRLQNGTSPVSWKPFPGLVEKAFELRAKDKLGIYRMIYVTFVKEKIVVLHCFQKKSASTSKPDVNLASKRLKQYRSEYEK